MRNNCPICGEKNNNDEKFCSSCGAILLKNKQNEQYNTTVNQTERYEDPYKKSNMPIISAVIAVVVAVIIISAAIFSPAITDVFNSNKNEDTSSSNQLEYLGNKVDLVGTWEMEYAFEDETSINMPKTKTIWKFNDDKTIEISAESKLKNELYLSYVKSEEDNTIKITSISFDDMVDTTQLFNFEVDKDKCKISIEPIIDKDADYYDVTEISLYYVISEDRKQITLEYCEEIYESYNSESVSLPELILTKSEDSGVEEQTEPSIAYWKDMSFEILKVVSGEPEELSLTRSSVPLTGEKGPEEWGEILAGDVLQMKESDEDVSVTLIYAPTYSYLLSEYFTADIHENSDEPNYFIDTTPPVTTITTGELYYIEEYESQITEKTLVGYWDFDEENGTTVFDSTDHENDGTISGQIRVDGISGKSLSFNGEYGYVLVDNDNSLNFRETNEFTLSAFIKRESTSRNHTEGIISKGTSAYCKGYNLGFKKDNSVYFSLRDGTNTNTLISNLLINDTEWHKIVAIWDGETMSLYIDDQLDSTKDLEGVVVANDNKPLEFGNHWGYTDNNHPFHGLIDEIKIFNYALSDGEI